MLVLRVLYPLLVYAAAVLLSGLLLPVSVLAYTAAGALAAAPALYWIFLRDQKERARTERLLVSPERLLWLLLLGSGSCVLVNTVILTSGLNSMFRGYEQVQSSLYAPPLWFQIAASGLLIPAAEELVFRALGYRRLRDHMGVWPAAFWSAAFFGVYHGNVVQGLYAFLIGMVLAFVYECCGTAAAPFLLHAAANVTSLLVTYAGLTQLLEERAGGLAVIVGSAVVSSLSCLRIYQKRAYKEDRL